MLESSNLKEAKFLIKELLARLNAMEVNDYDKELNQLMSKLQEELIHRKN